MNTADSSPARTLLQKAYLHCEYGRFDEAVDCCRRAASVAPEHFLPPTLEGSFLIASGRVRQALSHLRKVVRRFPDQPLPRIYFAEACLLSGRLERASRALAEARRVDSCGEHAAYVASLEQTLEGLSAGDVPAPLVVPE